MNRKTYRQPSMKVIKVDSCDIICTSTSTMSLYNEEVDDESQGGYHSSIWGSQW